MFYNDQSSHKDEEISYLSNTLQDLKINVATTDKNLRRFEEQLYFKDRDIFELQKKLRELNTSNPK